MKINGEDVVPVGSLDELRPGRVAWVMPCASCGGKHRGMIGNVSRNWFGRAALEWFPPPACLSSENHYGLLEGVPDNVFLVVDGLPDREEDARQRRVLAYAAAGYAATKRFFPKSADAYRQERIEEDEGSWVPK